MTLPGVCTNILRTSAALPAGSWHLSGPQGDRGAWPKPSLASLRLPWAFGRAHGLSPSAAWSGRRVLGLRGDISRDLSQTRADFTITNLFTRKDPSAPARRLPSALISMTIGFLAKLASELHLRRMAPAPLLVFLREDHLGMRQLDSASAEVEFCADAR